MRGPNRENGMQFVTGASAFHEVSSQNYLCYFLYMMCVYGTPCFKLTCFYLLLSLFVCLPIMLLTLL